MKQVQFLLTLAVLLANMSWARAATAQDALPTASRALQLSAFGAATGAYTGLADGRNFSITAGADLGLSPWRGMRPTIEVRGTYPLDHGTVDSEKSILAGLKVEFLLHHRFRPYGNFLFGRGETDYGPYPYPYNKVDYYVTPTYIYSPGGGFDYQFSRSFAFKADGQFQRWGAAPTPSGVVYSKVGSVGLIYYFNFDHRRR